MRYASIPEPNMFYWYLTFDEHSNIIFFAHKIWRKKEIHIFFRLFQAAFPNREQW